MLQMTLGKFLICFLEISRRVSSTMLYLMWKLDTRSRRCITHKYLTMPRTNVVPNTDPFSKPISAYIFRSRWFSLYHSLLCDQGNLKDYVGDSRLAAHKAIIFGAAHMVRCTMQDREAATSPHIRATDLSTISKCVWTQNLDLSE